MDRATVLEQLKEVAVDVLGVDPGIVSETSSFKDDLDADSLDLVEVVMALEERFSISVPEDKLDGITTVGEAVDLVLGIADPAADGAPASDGETAAAGEPAESADRA
jgi:acyl carrier protein